MKTIIGYDAKRIVRNGTGLGSYGRTLVNDLIRRGDEDMELRLYAPDEGRDDLRLQVIGDGNAQFCYPDGHPSKLRKDLWRMRGIVKDLRRDGVQVYHGLSGELPIGLHKAGIHSVVTIHDLIFLRHPEFYRWADRQIYKWKFQQTIKEADRIIAISERTRQDILAYGGDALEHRISLIYQSFSPRFSIETSREKAADVQSRYRLPKRYILSVGTIEERKNIGLAARALRYLPQGVELVVVGHRTKYADEVERHYRNEAADGRLHMLSGVPDADLPAIYAQAEAFVYPSRYEGFGIPIIEAIAAGLPVVACTGSCLEEAGGPDCLYVHPDDERDLAESLKMVLRGAPGRNQRISRSREYIRRFEGNNVATQVADLYQQLLLEQ